MMMKIFEYDEAKQVVVCGDIHGAFETMVFKTCVQYGMTDTLVIVAGDCGFGGGRNVVTSYRYPSAARNATVCPTSNGS